MRHKKIFLKRIDDLLKYIKILIVVDLKRNSLNNIYMLIWRVVNNIDSNRDLIVKDDTLLVDATNKNKLDNFPRIWPGDVLCTKEVLVSLKKRKIIEIDDQFIEKWGLI